MKRLRMGIVMVLLLITSFISFIAVDLFYYAKQPVKVDSMEKTVTILPGQGFGALSRQLTAEGLISHPSKFKLFAKIYRYDKKLKAGEYSLSGNMSPRTILETLASGNVKLRRLMIPEGYNLKQISNLIAKSGLESELEFLKAASDEAFLKQEGIIGKTVEGYLFPDTYFFPRGIGAKRIISTMVQRFRSVYTDEHKHRTNDLGFSVHEIVILASIIEKETGISLERPVISSVFHNRLRTGMPLESDPTVIYGIENFDGDITRKHLQTPTPYNTYTQKGFPLGPIANPGKASIQAALFPADTPYIYFVSRGDGTHQFSTCQSDHQEAVKLYQLNH